ncbi:31999_t:CDS:2, partial [Racocetra persica]
MPSRKNIVRRACVTNKSHRLWSVKEKLMVIFYLERINSVRATAKHFEIKPKQVHEWRNKKQELLNAAPYALTLNREHRNMQHAVTRNMVVRKAKALAQTDEIKNAYPNIASFKFSIFWLSQFLCHNDLSNRRRTTVAQHLPAALAKKQTLWVKESWDEISPRLIQSAFKCCGISVEIDRSEDDLVFDYELLDEENASNENTEEVLTFDNIDGDEYEEVEVDNVWE